MKIRKANAADAGAIAIFSRKAFVDTYARFNSKENMDKFLSEQFSSEILEAQVRNPHFTFFIAENDAAIIGCIFLRDDRGIDKNKVAANEIEIARLYADTAFHGKGVGKGLMLAALDFAAKIQKKYVWLGVWKENQKAIDFYSSFGFEKTGEQTFLLGDDCQLDWIMQFRIPENQ